jgi:hypothetical protein
MLDPPADVRTVADLMQWLVARGEGMPRVAENHTCCHRPYP